MPELPEIETIRRDLEERLIGCWIAKAKAYDAKILENISPRQFARQLKGKTITGLQRHGKALIIELSDDLCLLVHLRMTGRLYPISEEEDLPNHARAVLHLDNGERLVFVNPRRFGRLEVIKTSQLEESRLLRNMGIDAWTGEIDDETLADMLNPHSVAIKKFLLDQRHIAGIGNIYASEILFRCRIHPDRPANFLTATERRKLLRAMRCVLGEAIQSGGTTLSDSGYRRGDRSRGAFQGKLRVYGREGKRCVRRGCRCTIVRTTHARRSTYYCPRCQEME